MKRFLSLLMLLPLLCFAQGPGVGLDQLPSASVIGDTGLIFGYQPGSGGSGATVCARGWCPVSYTLLQIKTYIGSSGAVGFAGITSGTNSSATMTVGSGSTLTFSGAGIVNANELNGEVSPVSAALVGTDAGGGLAAVTVCLPVNGCTGVANTGTYTNNGVNQILTGTGPLQWNVGGSTTPTLPAGAYTVGYLGLPPCTASSNAAAQACPLTGSTSLLLPASGQWIITNCGSACTITIPANASVAFPVGVSCLAFLAVPGSAVVTVAITSDTMSVIGTGSTGSRTLTPTGSAPAGMAVCKYLSTSWVVVEQGGVT